MDINGIAVIVALLFWPVIGLVVLFNWARAGDRPKLRSSAPPPVRGLSKEEEARDAMAGEMWREMGE